MNKHPLSERDYDCLFARLGGLKLAGVGERHGISAERVRQIIARCVRRLVEAERKWAAAEIVIARMVREARMRMSPKPAMAIQEYLREERLRLKRMELFLSTPGGAAIPEMVPNNLTIDDLSLSCRAYHCLKGNDIQTVAQLCDLTADRLLRVKNFGVVSLRELRDELDRIGVVHRLGEGRGGREVRTCV